MAGKLFVLLPPLVGVLLGLFIQFLPGYGGVALTALAGALAHVTMRLCARAIPRWPRPMIAATQTIGLVVPIAVIALTTCLTTWASLNIGAFIERIPGVDAARVQANAKEVGTLLLGAVTTFIAGLWLDDAQKNADSPFRPEHWAREAFKGFEDRIARRKATAEAAFAAAQAARAAAFPDPQAQTPTPSPAQEAAEADFARAAADLALQVRIEEAYALDQVNGGPMAWSWSEQRKRLDILAEGGIA